MPRIKTVVRIRPPLNNEKINPTMINVDENDIKYFNVLN